MRGDVTPAAGRSDRQKGVIWRSIFDNRTTC